MYHRHQMAITCYFSNSDVKREAKWLKILCQKNTSHQPMEAGHDGTPLVDIVGFIDPWLLYHCLQKHCFHSVDMHPN